jgi:hypothetical protein
MTQDNQQEKEKKPKRILRLVRSDGTSIELNIVRAEVLGEESSGVIRIECTVGNDVAFSFNPAIIGEFADVDRIEVVREDP